MVGLVLRPIPSKNDLRQLPSTLKKNISNYVKRRSKSISKRRSTPPPILPPIINHNFVRPAPSYPDQPAYADFATFPNTEKNLCIPNEIILQIFSYCSWEDYESFSSVNRLWRQCAFDILLSKRYLEDEETPFATHSIFQTLVLRTVSQTRFVPTVKSRFDGFPITSKSTAIDRWRKGIQNSPYMSEPASFPPLSLIRCHIYEAQWYGKFYWCYSRAFDCYSDSRDRVVTVGHVVERIRQEYARVPESRAFMSPYTLVIYANGSFLFTPYPNSFFFFSFSTHILSVLSVHLISGFQVYLLFLVLLSSL